MDNIKDLVRPNILELLRYSSAREEYTGEAHVFLDANENPFGSLNRYPDPYQKALKKELASLKGVSAKNIFIGNGSDEVIDLAFRIFCEPGIDRALSFTPSYGMYEVSAAINNIALQKVALNEIFQIDRSIITPYLRDPSIKLLFLCSPNNPTGNLLKSEDVEFILTRFKGIVILDEAYIDFSPTASLIGMTKRFKNLIVSQTFSKAWGLASARIGVAYGDAETIALYNKVKPPYNVSGLSQKAALNALENKSKQKETIVLLLTERKKLVSQLSEIPIVKRIYPSQANFILIEVQDANRLYNTLITKKIILRNRNSQVKNCLRITIGTPEENDLLIHTLKKLS